MKKNQGSNLVEYAIPLALIGIVVGVGLYNLCTNNSILNYIMNSTNMQLEGGKLVMKNTNDASTAVISNNVASSSSSGSGSSSTSTLPQACTSSPCSIDFGDIVLSGIPKDINDIVETSGVSGGMDALIALLDQIAKQYEEKGQTEAAKEIKILATTGHNMAVIQKDFENFVFNTCKGDKKCLDSYVTKKYPKPAGYDETYQSFPTDVTYEYAPWLTSMGTATSGSPKYSEDAISAFYQKTLSQIKSNSAISDNVKGIIQELSWDIGTLAQKWTGPLAYLITTNRDSLSAISTYDPLTGKEVEYNYNNNTSVESMYQAVQNIKAPELTNVDSSLVCASGGYTDSGTSCH